MSPAGDAFATLPPIVPRFWIWTPPTVPQACGQQRDAAAHQRVPQQLRVRGERADDQGALRLADARPRPQRREVEERAAGEAARVPRHHEVGAPRDRERVLVSVEEPDGLGRRARPKQGRGLGVAPHARLRARRVFAAAGARRATTRGLLHRAHDVLVAGAAAQVAGELAADRAVVGAATALQVGRGSHQHARRADPALSGTFGEEGFLQRGEPLRPAERLHGRHAPTRHLGDRDEAAHHGLAVEQHGAGPALALAAAFLGPGQGEVLAKHVEQAPHPGAGVRARLAVDGEADPHAAASFPRALAIRSGVIGSASTKRAVACRTAAATAGAGKSIGSSPTPLAPNGPSE